MPFLTKITPASKEKAAAPPRPLDVLVKKTVAAMAQIAAPKDDKHVAKIEVHDTVSKVAWAYEKLRNAIDYQDEHLLRKNAIERMLRRRLVGGVTAEEIAEPLLMELIRGGYLANDAVPTTMIGATEDIINIFINFWARVAPRFQRSEREKLFSWYVGIVSVQLSELYVPAEHDDRLVDLMYDVVNPDISFAEEHLSAAEKDAQVFIAIQRTLMKSDQTIIRHRLFIRQHPEWLKPTTDDITAIADQAVQIRRGVDSQLFHPAGELLQRIIKKYVIIFWVFDDIVQKYGAAAVESELVLPDTLAEEIRTAYEIRRKTVGWKIAKNIIRSIVYVFITKMIIALVIEIPVDRWLSAQKAIDFRQLAINTLTPPFILAFIGATIRPPGKKNEDGVVKKVQDLVYRGRERNAIVKPRKPLRRSALFAYVFRLIYALTFVVVFGLIVWALIALHFTPIGLVIFLLFLTIVSFFGIRVRLLAKELLVEDQKESLFTVIFDFFSVPILQVGRWIAIRTPKINVLLFFFDVIIEAPLKAVIEATEGFLGFLREKREEIY